jgi:hypothetical protein
LKAFQQFNGWINLLPFDLEVHQTLLSTVLLWLNRWI